MIQKSCRLFTVQFLFIYHKIKILHPDKLVTIPLPDLALSSAPHRVTGELEMGGQFHLPMEPLFACAVPMEDGYSLTATTQHMNETQSVVAAALNVPANR